MIFVLVFLQMLHQAFSLIMDHLFMAYFPESEILQVPVNVQSLFSIRRAVIEQYSCERAT